MEFGLFPYCPHALADGIQRIRIREKMLVLNSVIYTLCENRLLSYSVPVSSIVIFPVLVATLRTLVYPY